jgi:hypothetical protein
MQVLAALLGGLFKALPALITAWMAKRAGAAEANQRYREKANEMQARINTVQYTDSATTAQRLRDGTF